MLAMMLLCGCGNTENAGDPGDSIAKAQEIAVIPAGAQAPVQTITAQDELEDFVHGLDLAEWQPASLPEDAVAAGSFGLSQEATVQFGEEESDGTLHDICRITLYDGPYVDFEAAGLHMAFRVTDEAAEFLHGFFE